MIFNSTEKIELIINPSLDPAFNLACEEVFFRRRQGCFALLWRNAPSIIIGRNQNAYAEIDTDFVARNEIPVIRRLTGGGAVWHDEGNLNFTFICQGRGSADFSSFLVPVVEFLKSLGLDAGFSGRNDIIVGGRKVSGCAKASADGRQMVHGTLLFGADMSALSKALRPNPIKLQSKGVASVRSRVANIGDLLEDKMSIEEFMRLLTCWLSERGGCKREELSKKDIEEIKKLAAEKYSQNSWNYGAAPNYSLERTALLGASLVTAHFEVKGGKIAGVKLFGDFFSDEEVSSLENLLVGVEHDRAKIEAALQTADLVKYIGCDDAAAFAELFL